MKQLKSDQHYALVVLILSAVYFYLGFGIQDDFFSDPIGSAWWVKGVALALITLSLLLLVLPSQFVGAFPKLMEWWQRIPFILVVVLYAYALPSLGFFISTPILITLVSLLFNARLLLAILSSIVMTICCYIVFDLLLGISLPDGIL